ncbi:MAG TPA: hypothetical protein VJT82_12950 [Pyrinomonadaceae bacterium]|nr:hypothetical protein [Pyrinomonadaceae bacterium]
MAHKLDNLYQGLPIFIISTGTSLRGFDFARLNGRITIGINRVVEHYHPSILHFIDVTAHKTHAKALRGYNGMIIAGEGAAPTGTHDNVFEIRRNVDTFELSGDMTTMSKKVGRSFADGWYGGGAGCTALHTAILLGGGPVYLLGYDFYEDNGRYFDEYDESRNAKDLYSIPFDGLEQLSRESWIPEVYNCNPRSRLTCFPHVDIDEVLTQTA